MQSYTYLILTIIASSSLHINDVYGAKDNKSKGKKAEESSKPTTSTSTNDKTKTDATPKQEPQIPIPKKEDIPFYYYTFDNEYQTVLKSPNTLLNVKFNGNILPFDDDSKLPTQSISSFKVFACLHNNPILIRAQGAFGYVLYSPDPANGKWKNYEIGSLNSYETLDKDGIKYYKSDGDDASKNINNIIEGKLPQLCVSLCKGDKCVNRSSSKNPALDVSVQLKQSPKEDKGSAREGTSQTKFTPVVKAVSKPGRLLYDKLTYYSFDIDLEYRSVLNFPNKIESIKFNENTLEFAPGAKLPDYRVITIVLYTCPHNHPLLIRFHGLYQYTFYLADKATNKWANCTVSGVSRCQMTDSNGNGYYTFSKEDEIKYMYNGILSDCTELYKTACKEHSGDRNPLLKEAPLEIKLVKE